MRIQATAKATDAARVDAETNNIAAETAHRKARAVLESISARRERIEAELRVTRAAEMQKRAENLAAAAAHTRAQKLENNARAQLAAARGALRTAP